ncbi:MAG: hypothetical protein WCG20_00705 [bacterium]
MTEESFREIIEKLNIMITESRNHHEILYYHLEDKIRLLAEGQAMTNENLERFKEYVEERFNKVDSNLNILIMRDPPSGAEFKILKKQVTKLNDEVFG